MNAEQRAEYQKRATEGEDFRTLRQHRGFKAFIGVLDAMYLDALESLIEKEDPVARAKIQAIQEIVQRMDDRIKLGEEARTILQSPQDTGEAAPGAATQGDRT